MTPEEAQDWIFPPDAQPLPCPHCGRAPALVQDSHLSRFEYRRWFGLVLHRRGMSVVEGRSDGEYARRAATRAWNRGLEVKPRTGGEVVTTSDDYKVFVEVDGVIYRGRRSVHQTGNRVYIDGKLVGTEVDNDGKPLAQAPPLAQVHRPSWWTRMLGRLRSSR